MPRYDEEDEVKKGGKRVAIGLAALVAGILGLRSCSCVPAGHVRVVDLFGSVQEKVLEPGIHFPMNPLAKRIAFDVRTKETKETMNTQTKEGLMTEIGVSILYHVAPEKAADIYKNIGTQFKEVIVVPMLRNITRDVIVGYSSEDLYNPNRVKIASDIESKLGAMYAKRGIVLESVLLRDVKLPPEVTSAIESKISTKQEAERKRIEAKGIADAQRIIAGGLTPEYLQWKYIDTLHALGNSPNNTFVITPYNQNLLPVLPLESKK